MDTPIEKMPTGRKSIDCRDDTGAIDCTVKISADTEEEVLESAIQHVVSIHKEKDTPELREHIQMSIRDDDMKI